MALPKAEKPAKKGGPAEEAAAAAAESAGTDGQPPEATVDETATKSGKATAATQQATDEATGN